MPGEEIHQFGPYTITAYAEPEEGGVHGIAYCPLCQFKAESHDHVQGSGYAVNVAITAVRAHLRTEHNLEEPDEFAADVAP